jgi:catechol 2,3-dioxygenase-like lactoylglutathione lyase family enzyme
MAHKWYTRPVFFVADVKRSLDFYVNTLAFVKKWPADGTDWTVCQVDRGECEIILCQHDTRRDKARLFIELTPAGREELRRELAERSIPWDQIWWGYDCIRVMDPDGNELLFPLEG